MKHQFISGEIAGTMARVFLRDVTITRCRINDVDEPEAATLHQLNAGE